MLKKLPNVVCMYCWVILINDDIINNTAISTQLCEGFIHSVIIVLGIRDPVRYQELLELSERCNEFC